MNLLATDDDDDALDPLAAGSAGMPDTQGEGCTLRFSPEALNSDMGADYSLAEACEITPADPE